jgi:O-antigen/teichoic acid export membrane protein
MADNKRIAKNTLFLYFRMILIMGVTLYMSRVVLDKLGVDDFGLYNVVGGVVGMLSFLNGTLSIGTSRFLTYELGTGDSDKLRQTFSTALYTHVILAVIILIAMESFGLWYVYNKMIIPPDRFSACVWVFHLSILTTLVAITQVPYTATIMAHERMEIYAYISIFEAFAKLGVCFLLSYGNIDRLILYASLLFFVQLIVSLCYRIYSIKNFEESRLSRTFNKAILKRLLSFSGWNIMANISNTLGNQGTLVLINLFFTSAIAAAQSVAGQVSVAIMVFVNNFRNAINPQVIKLYAAGDKKGSKKLTLETTVYCFDLILMLGLPAIVVMDRLMHIWLVEVPEYAVLFTQWIIVRNIIGTFSSSFYTPMLAANKMKINSIAAVILGIGEFVLLYVFLKIGFGPMWIQYLGCIAAIGFSLIVKPFVLIKQIDYSTEEILICYWICLKTLFLSCILSILPIIYLSDNIAHSIIKATFVGLSVIVSSYVFLGKQTKQKVNIFVKSKLHK